MQIEVGKYYKTRDGRKVGPIDTFMEYVIARFESQDRLWWPDGKHGSAVVRNNPQLDIIAEWTDEPARTTLSAIDHLRKAAELFLADGNDKAAFDVLGVVLDHE